MVPALSKPAKACRASCSPRFTWPAAFERYSVYRFFYLSLIFNLFAVAIATDKTYYANREVRSCVCNNTFVENKDYFPHKVNNDFSSGLWSVSYHNHYKKLTTVNPDGSTDVWYLVLCGTPIPDEANDPTHTIEIPIKSVMFDSSTQIHLLEYLNQRTSLAEFRGFGCAYGCSPFSGVNSCLNLQVADGLTTIVDDAAKVTADLSIGAEADFGGSSKSFQQDCTDQPLFRVRKDSAANPTKFGTIEYVEALSIFFNREEAANAVVAAIDDRYQCSKTKAQDQAVSRTALVVQVQGLFGDGDCSNFDSLKVALRGCSDPENSHPTCDLVLDAGGSPLTFDTSAAQPGSFGTYSLNISDFVALPGLSDLDVIIYDNDLTRHLASADCSTVFNTIFENVPAWINGEVYDIFKTVSDSGDDKYDNTDWFEGAEAEPDVLLLDFIEAIQPTLLDHERRFLRKINEPVNFLTASDCADINAPLYTGWTAIPCDGSSSNTVIPGLEDVQNADVCTGNDEPPKLTPLDTTGCESESAAAHFVGSSTLVAFALYMLN